MNKRGHIINKVLKNSIASQLEIEPGDVLISINGSTIKDVFDFHFLINDEYLVVLIQKTSGEEWELEIEKDYNEDLGIEFEESLMDSYQSCKNKCMFCFIDQMPKGMRDTLYFKDDDARLSFLQGNYITLTNMSDEDIDRIILYKLAPINISIHTTNKELRCKMLNNRFAGDALEKINRLYEAGIEMNSQIVLCKGYNDGEELDHTIRDLSNYLPIMKSLSVVPVGLTKYRDDLIPLEKFRKDEALDVLKIIEKWQTILLEKYGSRFVHASDEWYITAELPIPEADIYEGYGQIENGVGMVRSLIDEFDEYFTELKGDSRKKTLSIATGVIAVPTIRELSNKIMCKFPNISINVYTIQNNFFGTDITVAGLLTGQDIISQLSEQQLGDYLLLPSVLLRADEDVLLDDYTVKDIEKALQTQIRIVKSDGRSFIETILR